MDWSASFPSLALASTDPIIVLRVDGDKGTGDQERQGNRRSESQETLVVDPNLLVF
jgi:hypothetical protein